VLVLHVLAVSAPFAQALFETVALLPAQWAVAAGVGASILVLDEAGKRLARVASRRASASTDTGTYFSPPRGRSLPR
jgi:cation transport ATPase-like protein